MVIKLLQQSTFRRYAAIVLSPFFIFCCFRCVTVPLTGVINYVFFAFMFVIVSVNMNLKHMLFLFVQQ